MNTMSRNKKFMALMLSSVALLIASISSNASALGLFGEPKLPKSLYVED